MKTFNLKNPTLDTDLSFALSEFIDVVESQGAKVEVTKESNNTKGSLILELSIILGESIAASAIYDLLKYSLERLGDRLAGATPIEIDEKSTTVNEVRGND